MTRSCWRHVAHPRRNCTSSHNSERLQRRTYHMSQLMRIVTVVPDPARRIRGLTGRPDATAGDGRKLAAGETAARFHHDGYRHLPPGREMDRDAAKEDLGARAWRRLFADRRRRRRAVHGVSARLKRCHDCARRARWQDALGYEYSATFRNAYHEGVGPGPYAMPQVIGDRVVTASGIGQIHSLDKRAASPYGR